jgi:hypothetical protein
VTQQSECLEDESYYSDSSALTCPTQSVLYLYNDDSEIELEIIFETEDSDSTCGTAPTIGSESGDYTEGDTLTENEAYQWDQGIHIFKMNPY